MTASAKRERPRQLATPKLRVPARDWPYVSTGRQTQFRHPVGAKAFATELQPTQMPLPIFVVAYRLRPRTEMLLLLEETRVELMAAISRADLADLGYTGEHAYRRFRTDWRLANRNSGYRPDMKVSVFTVRLPREDDELMVGKTLVQHFFGEHLAAKA